MDWENSSIKKTENRNKVLIIAIIGALIFLAVFAGIVYLNIINEKIENAGLSSHGHATLKYNGETRKVRSYIRTLLIIGTDNYSDEKRRDDGFYNYDQADFLALLVIDLKNRTISPIQINRDTMCDVPWLSVNGKIGGTNFEQITLSHTSGSGGKDSCKITADTVSDLLFGAPVDGYLAFTMDSVPVMTDLVGGVKVTIDEDLTDINETFTKGAEVVLHGEDALAYVRTRKHDTVDANLPRMSRHRQYLESFMVSARNIADNDSDIISKSYEELSPYITTTLTFEGYADVLNWMDIFEITDIKTPDGEYVTGEYAEFYPDMDELWKIVTEALC